MEALKQRYADIRANQDDPHIQLRQARLKYGSIALMARHLATCVKRWTSDELPADATGLRLLHRELETLAYWCAAEPYVAEVEG